MDTDVSRHNHKGPKLVNLRSHAYLINTSLQRGDQWLDEGWNRFNGHFGNETVKTVRGGLASELTPLKRGVNESYYRYQRAFKL